MSPSEAVQSTKANPELEAKPEATKPKRGLYTPKPKQTQVLARHTMGESNRKIAREEKLDRATVAQILTQPEAVAQKARQKSEVERLGFKAIVAIEEALDSGYIQLAATTGIKLLEGTGVLDKRGLSGMIDDQKARHLRKFDDLLDNLGVEEFPWPPAEPPSSPEPKKRARRKMPKPQMVTEPLDDQGSEGNSSS